MGPPRYRARRFSPGFALVSLAACSPPQPLDEASTAAQASSTSSTSTDPTRQSPSTDTTTTPTTSTGTGTSDTTDTSFPLKPDGGALGEPCDTFAQNCPKGQKCTLWAHDGHAWDSSKCVEVTGYQEPGEACKAEGGGLIGVDDCEAGAICSGVDQNGVGTCVSHCLGSPDAPTCPRGLVCESSRIISLCYEHCDPLLQDCQREDALCLPFDGTGYCERDLSPYEGVANDPCSSAHACKAGYHCLTSAEASAACLQNYPRCCQPFCEYPGGACPNADQTCKQVYNPNPGLPPNAQKLGVCAITP